MNFEIKHRFSGAVLASLETESLHAQEYAAAITMIETHARLMTQVRS